MNKKSRNIISAILCIVMIISGMGLFNIINNEFHAASSSVYLTTADSVTYVGNSGGPTTVTTSGSNGSETYVGYNNTSPDNSKYVVFSNAVNSFNGEKYDLVIYPFKKGENARVCINTKNNGHIPTIRTVSGSAGYKCVITEHGNINNPINVKLLFGMSDIDTNEYVQVPTDFSVIHVGKNLSTVSALSGTEGTRYKGTTGASSNQEMFDYGCVYGEIEVSTNGFTFYYGSATEHSMWLSFDEIKDYHNIGNIYKIEFNANGGSGVPSTIEKNGTDTSTVMGDIGSTVPTRSGYIFRGWSASSTFNNKRIAYSSASGGSAASDGTSATTTSSSWSYATYCSNTGGDSNNTTLTLYAQWEAEPTYTHTLAYDANGGSGAPSSSTVTNTSTTHSMTVSSTQPTRTGHTFGGWNTNSSGTGTDYSAGGSVSVGANATVTLYAKWTINSSTLKVNPNGGTWNSSSDEQSFTQNYNTTKSIPVPTREGHTFNGWTRSGTNGTMSSLNAVATYTFGATNGATDTITAGWTANNYTVTYIDRISGTTTDLGSSTASKPYGSTVRGEDKGNSTVTGAYYTGYYYVSDTSATVTTSGATVYRYFNPQNYTVTYIDRIMGTTTDLGSSTASKPYASTVKGIDAGSSTADNAYYKNYALVAGTNGYTTAVVDTSNNTVVYRYFRWLTTDIAGTVNWTDNHNAYETRPDKVKIVIFQNGVPVTSVVTVSGTKDISPVILNTSGDVNDFTFPDMPVYDSSGKPYTYEVRMYDLDANADIKNPSSVMSLEYPESKYVTTQNGYNIYNRLDNNFPDIDDPSDGFTVSGVIHWVDSGNKLGLRPSTVTIELYQDGEPLMVNGEHYTITVDAIGDNTYKFIKLPKYKYVDGEPVPYEYTAVEKIVSNYVKDGVIYPLYDIHTDENMGEYEKLHFTNYIKTDGPLIPIVPVEERDNTITIVTNTEDKVDIVLKMLDFYITESPEDVNVQYGPEYNGDEYNLSVSELGEIIKHLPSGKYEIDINESKYELKGIHISDNTDNVRIIYEDGKYYLVIDHVPGDSFGTVNIELEEKTEYYEARMAINNYFKTSSTNRIVGGYIELPEDQDVSVVEILMMCNYFTEAISEPVSAELPEEEMTETDTSEIEDTEDKQVIEDAMDAEDEQDVEESTSVIEDESEETQNSMEDLENDFLPEMLDIIVGN